MQKYNKKENNFETGYVSIFTLKILLYLSHKGGTVSFSELTKYLNRSKSQLSVALKKMVSDHLVSKSISRPMLITITKKGINTKRIAIKNIVKYQNLKPFEKKAVEQTESFTILNRRVALGNNIDKIKEIKPNLEIKTKTFNAFIIEAKKTIKEELIEYFEDKVPLHLIKDITLSISNRIHDMLFEYF